MPRTARQEVIPGATIKFVVTLPAIQMIVAGAAQEDVLAIIAEEVVVAAAPIHEVVAVCARNNPRSVAADIAGREHQGPRSRLKGFNRASGKMIDNGEGTRTQSKNQIIADLLRFLNIIEAIDQ